MDRFVINEDVFVFGCCEDCDVGELLSSNLLRLAAPGVDACESPFLCDLFHIWFISYTLTKNLN